MTQVRLLCRIPIFKPFLAALPIVCLQLAQWWLPYHDSGSFRYGGYSYEISRSNRICHRLPAVPQNVSSISAHGLHHHHICLRDVLPTVSRAHTQPTAKSNRKSVPNNVTGLVQTDNSCSRERHAHKHSTPIQADIYLLITLLVSPHPDRHFLPSTCTVQTSYLLFAN